MLNNLAFQILLVVIWIALLWLGWVSARHPQRIDEFNQEHFPSIFKWSELILPKPSGRHVWIRVKGVLVIVLMIALAAEIALRLFKSPA